MAYKNKYILSSSSHLNQFYEVYLDYLNYIGTSSVITSSVDGLIIRSTTADQDRFAALLGQECLLNIFVGKAGSVDDSGLTVYDLISQQDNNIRVTVYKERDYTKSIFQGFVVVEDNHQPYLDPPFILSIRALDGIGMLKKVDFLDTTGAAFAGTMTPLGWIAQMLYKTGQKLNLRVYFNVINTAFPFLPPIEAFYINVNTFLLGQPQTNPDPTIDLAASAADDCNTVLEKICRNLRCRLFQQDGVWNLVNIWEYQNPAGYSYIEYQIQEPVAGICATTAVARKNHLKYDVQVGYNQIIHPVKNDAHIALKLATKSEKFKYTYDQSLNKVCNQDFSSGSLNPAYDETISSLIIDSSVLPVGPMPTFGQSLFCWDEFNGTSTFNSIYPTNPPTKRAFIRIVKDVLGFEFIRFGVIDSSGVSPFFSMVRTKRLIIDTNDIFQMSFSWRFRNNISISSAAGVAAVYLYGDDGTFWVLRCVDDNSIYDATKDANFRSQWIQTDSNFRVTGGSTIYIQTSDLTGLSTNIWQIATVNQTGPAHTPVSGTIEVFFVNQYPNPGNEFWFKDIKITILPYLLGGYSEVKGDFNYSKSLQDIKLTDEQSVEISDSPKRYFKGAILQPDGKSLMAPTWTTTDSPLAPKRFTQLMELMVFNAIYRQPQKIEGTMRGLTWVDQDLVVREAGFLNIYYFSDHPVPTKRFMLTSFENDYMTASGRRVFMEITNDQNDTAQVDPADPANGQYIFQYLF